MSTAQTPTATLNGAAGPRPADEHEVWQNRTRIVLNPIAAPSILGLFGFSAATLMVAANLAGWYGGPKTPELLFPFAAIFGGVAQFLAGMWAYKARDGLATAMHGMWGSFWIAYGILWAMFTTGVVAAPTGVYAPALGFWFIMLAAITWVGFFASLAENAGLAATLLALAGGASILASAYLSGAMWLEHTAGWVLVFSAGFAFYTAAAMMLSGSTKRTILPLGSRSASANVPGRTPMAPVEYPAGMPGVKVGQ